MSFNTKWDVVKYRTEYESEEHWQLRRNFMDTHKEKFPEERLVCLAQVFTNIEFLGCRYPAETMQLVEQLSEGVADEYREKQKSKLQRTFVKASDAAGAKVKGLKRPAQEEEAAPLNLPHKITKRTESSEKFQNSQGLIESRQPPIISTTTAPLLLTNNSESVQSLISKPLVTQGIKFVPPGKTPEILPNDGTEKDHIEYEIKKCEKDSFVKVVVDNDAKALNKEIKKLTRKPVKNSFTSEFYQNHEEHIRKIDTQKFGKLILLESRLDENNPFNVLNRSCAGCRIPFRIDYQKEATSGMFCRLYVNKLLVVSAFGATRRAARDVAASRTLEKLKDVCYTLTVKKQRISDDFVVDREIINSITSPEVEKCKLPVDSIVRTRTLLLRIPEDNIGSKLMRSMGWAGGGLGKAEQGIQEPVRVSLQKTRAGLGATSSKKHSLESADVAFMSKTEKYLSQFVMKDLSLNLIFKSGEFSLVELTAVNKLAKSMGLQCCLHKKHQDHHIEISKAETLELILARMLRCGAYCDEYFELHKPRNRKLLENFESETLQASDSSYLASLSRDNNQSSYKNEPENKGLTNFSIESIRPVISVETSTRKERRKMKLLQRIQQKLGSSKVKHKALTIEENKSYSLEPIAAGPYGSFFLVEHENPDETVWSIMIESAAKNIVPIKYEFGGHKGIVFGYLGIVSDQQNCCIIFS